mmetsp:Transcript_21501/g.51012  ORF Transcript_21501/g.51012 Transcript_21501/m.51012 type:complete len:229 (-) Transcript_21501:221-907(-)
MHQARSRRDGGHLGRDHLAVEVLSCLSCFSVLAVLDQLLNLRRLHAEVEALVVLRRRRSLEKLRQRALLRLRLLRLSEVVSLAHLGQAALGLCLLAQHLLLLRGLPGILRLLLCDRLPHVGLQQRVILLVQLLAQVLRRLGRNRRLLGVGLDVQRESPALGLGLGQGALDLLNLNILGRQLLAAFLCRSLQTVRLEVGLRLCAVPCRLSPCDNAVLGMGDGDARWAHV